LFVGLDEQYITHIFDQLKTSVDGGIIMHMLSLIKNEEMLNETAAGYLLKVISHLVHSEHGSRVPA
jgi:hypothetical protein